MIPAGAVTTADLYRELIGMRSDVVRAMTRLEMADRIHSDHELRLRSLEQFKWKLLGAVLAGSAGVSAVVTWVGLTVGQHLAERMGAAAGAAYGLGEDRGLADLGAVAAEAVGVTEHVQLPGLVVEVGCCGGVAGVVAGEGEGRERG